MKKNLASTRTNEKALAHAMQRGFGAFRQRPKRVEVPEEWRKKPITKQE
ncbi:MAG: hypothetical protein Q4P20_00075 [Eubacteriales bacterium]|nr:hypothetical protein [Eubacteriales bacterium]